MTQPTPVDEFDPIHVHAVEEAELQAVDKSEAQHRAALELRKGAYMRVFIGGAPTKEDRAMVLRDLGLFCRADETAFRPTERETTLVLGRQEVMHRIRYHTRFPVDTLMQLYPLAEP
jgi:hypothetical protein